MAVCAHPANHIALTLSFEDDDVFVGPYVNPDGGASGPARTRSFLYAALLLIQGLGVLPNATARAQPAPIAAPVACDVVLDRATVSMQLAASVIATAIEYGHGPAPRSWRVSPDLDRRAIIADPSSHLHMLGSYHIARASVTATCDDRAAEHAAVWTGAVIALSVGVAKEVADGFYNGFSFTDLGVDAAGVGFAVAQSYLPALRHVKPTFSVSPRVFATTSGARSAMVAYGQQTAWLSANPEVLLPQRAARAWPSLVRLSVGRRAYSSDKPSDYIVGVDLDVMRLPGTHPAWLSAKSLLQHLRLPGPAIVIGSNGTRLLGLYW